MKLKNKLHSLLPTTWCKKATDTRQRLNKDIDAVIDSLNRRELKIPAMMTCIRPLLPLLVITVLLHGLFFYALLDWLISNISPQVAPADEMLFLQLTLGTGLFVLLITAVSGFLFFLLFQHALFFLRHYFAIPEDIRNSSRLIKLTRRALTVILYPGVITIFSAFLFFPGENFLEPSRVIFAAFMAIFCVIATGYAAMCYGLLLIKNRQNPQLNAVITKFRQMEPVSSRQIFMPVTIAQCALVGFLFVFQFLTALRSWQEIAAQCGLILFSIFTLMVMANNYFRLKDDFALNNKKTDIDNPCFSTARKKLHRLGYTLLAIFTMILLARLALPLPDGLRYSFVIECLILLPLTLLLLHRFRTTLIPGAPLA